MGWVELGLEMGLHRPAPAVVLYGLEAMAGKIYYNKTCIFFMPFFLRSRCKFVFLALRFTFSFMCTYLHVCKTHIYIHIHIYIF